MNYETNFGCTVSHWSHFHGNFDIISIFFKALHGLGAMWFDGELSHWNPYKSSTQAISQHGNDISKNVQCWYLFLGHGAHLLPSEVKNTPVAAVSLCNLFKELESQLLQTCNSSDFYFHLIKLQLNLFACWFHLRFELCWWALQDPFPSVSSVGISVLSWVELWCRTLPA